MLIKAPTPQEEIILKVKYLEACGLVDDKFSTAGSGNEAIEKIFKDINIMLDIAVSKQEDAITKVG